MAISAAVRTSLAWLGRQGPRAIGISIVIGIAFPWIGQLCRPFISAAVFILLTTAFMQVDAAAARGLLRRPGPVLWATVWTALAVPVVVGLCLRLLGLHSSAPELFLGLMLQAVASPIMSAPALAMILGLESTIVLMILILSTALVPVTAPLFTHLFIGAVFSVAPLDLAVRLAAILGGAFLAGFLIRRAAGGAAIQRNSEAINGFNIVVLFFFVAAVMESVGVTIFAAPGTTISFMVVAFVFFFTLLTLTSSIFLFTGRRRALSIGLMVSQRNMALMLAAAGSVLPDLAWLYFACAQFPLFLSPLLLSPVLRRLLTHRPPWR